MYSLTAALTTRLITLLAVAGFGAPPREIEVDGPLRIVVDPEVAAKACWLYGSGLRSISGIARVLGLTKAQAKAVLRSLRRCGVLERSEQIVRDLEVPGP